MNDIYNNELFLIVNKDEYIIDILDTSEIFEFTNLDDTNIKLDELTFGDTDTENINVYKGFVISAKYIPDSFNGLIPYIYIPISKNNEGIFIKVSTNVEAVIKKVEYLMSKTELKNLNIDNVYLFFGEKLTPSLQIIDISIDEELVERAKNLKIKTEKFYEN